MTVVVDAGVAIKWFVSGPGHRQAIALLGRQDVEAPDLILAELAQTAWLKQRRGELTADQAMAIASRAGTAFAALHPSQPLIGEAAALAVRLRRSVYDCLYLTFATANRFPLVTCDTGLCRAVQETTLGTLVVPLEIS